MRILHVADFASEEMGYQEFPLAVSHARLGAEVHLVTSNWNPSAPDYKHSLEPLLGPRKMAPATYDFAGVRVHRLRVTAQLRDRVWLRGLRRTVSTIDPDAVFVHGVFSPTALRIANIVAKSEIPLFIDNHARFSNQNRSLGSLAAYRMYNRVLHTLVAPRTDRFLGVAEECIDFMVREHRIPREHISLLPLGIDSELFRVDRSQGRSWRTSNGIPHTAVVITQTGKLTASKEALTLARAVGQLPTGERPIWLVFVGSGPEEYLARLVEEAQDPAGHRVLILPPVPVQRLPAVFQGSDVVCHPRVTVSSLEAAACGAIVLMNDEPVGVERAKSGIGRTFPTGDDAALTSELSAILELSQEERYRLGDSASGNTTSQFSYHRIARELDHMMRRAIATRPSAD